MKRGVNLHPIWTATTGQATIVQALTSIGAQTARVDAPWPTLEPTRGVYDQTHLGRLDTFISLCQAASIQVLLVPAYTPGWANGGQPSNVPPTNPQDFADYCGTLAARWPSLTGLEVWNEPDLNYSVAWSTGTPAQRAGVYLSMLQATYTAVKAAAPTCKVVAPAMGGYNTYSTQWLEAFMAAGPHGSYDVLSFHFYGDPPNHGNLTPAQLVSDAIGALFPIVRTADTTTPVWITESGWNSSPTGVSEAQQATDLTELWAALKQHRRIRRLCWYELTDGSNLSATDPESCYGLLNADFSPKPAAAAFEGLT